MKLLTKQAQFRLSNTLHSRILAFAKRKKLLRSGRPNFSAAVIVLLTYALEHRDEIDITRP